MVAGDRYSRLQALSWWDMARVREARALVAGAGALGNEVVKNLALVGWGQVTVVDFDRVEAGNLTRSVLFSAADVGRPKVDVLAAAAARINPDCRVTALDGDLRLALSSGLVARADVVLGCVDNVSARLALSSLAGEAGRPLIDGGLSTWEGTVSLFLPWQGPCYGCGLTAADMRELNLRRSCPAYAERARAARGVPTTPALASAVAAHMTSAALKWLHELRDERHFPAGFELRIDMLHDRFWKVGVPRNESCALHPCAHGPVEDVPLLLTDSWERIRSFWRERLSAEVTLGLPLFVLESWSCPGCGHEGEVRTVGLPDEQLACPNCDEPCVPSFRNRLHGREPYLGLSPAEMGFPAWSRISVTAGATEVVCELPPPDVSPLGGLERRP